MGRTTAAEPIARYAATCPWCRCVVALDPKGAKEGLRRWVGICAGCGRRLYLEAWEATTR